MVQVIRELYRLLKKERFFAFLGVSIALFSGCAGERPRVRTEIPPSAKVVTLPGTPKGELPKSYVVNGERYYPLPHADGFRESGVASWYGHPFHGRRTSSGEVYDMYRITAAHKTLPLYTIVKVTNLSNGKHVILPVNDRGPFVKGRIIDLSYAAAREIGMVGPGLTEVSVEALGKEVARIQGKDGTMTLVESRDFQTGDFTVQVGAFENRENALRLADRLKVLYKEVNVTVHQDGKNRTLHRVHVSLLRTLDEARTAERKLEEMGFKDAFLLRVEPRTERPDADERG
jgi:rare lipoprotein A